MVQSAVEIEIEIQNRNKLIIDEFVVPDPFTLVDGWLEEEEGKMFWPMVLSTDIFLYLMFHPSELKSDDLSDYKT